MPDCGSAPGPLDLAPESGCETLGDALWWSMVTFTTVGYGDLFPVTAAGRIVAVVLMLGGVALIGALSGALGSFFTTADGGGDDAPPVEPSEPTDDPVLRELRAVRAELEELRRTVAEVPPTEPGPAPPIAGW